MIMKKRKKWSFKEFILFFLIGTFLLCWISPIFTALVFGGHTWTIEMVMGLMSFVAFTIFPWLSFFSIYFLYNGHKKLAFTFPAVLYILGVVMIMPSCEGPAGLGCFIYIVRGLFFLGINYLILFILQEKFKSQNKSD